jgi:hypothetical protein
MNKIGAAIGLLLVATVATASPQGDTDTLSFDGSFRKTPKTTMLTGQPTEYQSIQAYIAAVVTPHTDASIKQQFPSLKQSSTNRIALEKKVVKVHCKLYAVRLEDDKDFHCIIGDSDTGPFINAEVSGVPASGSTAPFVAIRKQLRTLIGNAGVETSKARYYRPSPPMKLVVTGSLFYDAEHQPNTVGPAADNQGHRAAKAVTMWEIHPVHTMVNEH